MDISGETQADITHNILKTRLDEKGTLVPNSHSTELRNDIDKLNEQRQNGYCGSCYGGIEPEGGCCNSCDDVRQAYVGRGWSFNRPDSIEQVRHIPLNPPAVIEIDTATVCKRGLVRQTEGAGE